MPMMKERYGIPGSEVKNLRTRWRKSISKDSVWKDFDDFILWSSKNGYSKGVHLHKKRDDEPHGPNNSYYFGAYTKGLTSRERKRAARKKPAHEEYAQKNKLEDVVSPYCVGCERSCPGHGIGCVGWEEYFVENWNQNICRTLIQPQPEPEIRQTWQYEHPDLEREGLRFENRQT